MNSPADFHKEHMACWSRYIQRSCQLSNYDYFFDKIVPDLTLLVSILIKNTFHPVLLPFSEFISSSFHFLLTDLKEVHVLPAYHFSLLQLHPSHLSRSTFSVIFWLFPSSPVYLSFSLLSSFPHPCSPAQLSPIP